MRVQSPSSNNQSLNGGFSDGNYAIFTRGNKFFDLGDHRSNNLVTLSDRRQQTSSDNTTVDYYAPDIITAQDYSSFGSLLQERQLGNTPRYTYNDKQVDIETGWQDYGMRSYLVDVPVFGSVDPLSRSYPWYTPYQFAGNKPIACIDLDGLEELWITNNAFAPFDLFGSDLFGSYSGDGENRKFGDGGTYRTSGTAHINLNTAEPPTYVAGASTSTYPRVFGPAYTHKSPSKVEETYYYSSENRNYHNLQMHVSGSNGAVAFNAAPDIDAHVNIYLEKSSQDKTKVLVHGYVQGDKFPANETILSDKAGNTLVIGVSGPMSGKNIGPYKDLFGDAKRDMYEFKMTVLFNEDETIKGVELNGKQYNIEDWNKMFSTLNPKSSKVTTTTNNNHGTTEIKGNDD